jgi:hypothetical protein
MTMKARNWLVYLALTLSLAPCLPARAQGQRGMPAQPEGARVPKRVTLDLKGVPLDDAIRQILAATDLSVIITGELPKEPRVTLRLIDSDPDCVLQQLAEFGALRFGEQGGYSGGRVVIIGPQQIPFGAGPGGPGRSPQTTGTQEQAAAAAQLWSRAMPGAGAVSVDLDLSSTPFRDAVAEIMKQLPADDRAHIVVDDSVPRDLRVTARVRKMSLIWVLDSIVEQAGLTYGSVYEPPRPTPAAPNMVPAPRSGVWTIYIVPKPELRVSNGK